VPGLTLHPENHKHLRKTRKRPQNRSQNEIKTTYHYHCRTQKPDKPLSCRKLRSIYWLRVDKTALVKRKPSVVYLLKRRTKNDIIINCFVPEAHAGGHTINNLIPNAGQ